MTGWHGSGGPQVSWTGCLALLRVPASTTQMGTRADLAGLKALVCGLTGSRAPPTRQGSGECPVTLAESLTSLLPRPRALFPSASLV